MNISWDTQKYTDKFSFVHKYGKSVLELITIPPSKDENSGSTAIDLGCGNGELTKKLVEMGFCVFGIDDSEEMLNAARKLHPTLEFKKGNAIDFKLLKKADVIFSNAVFHWVDKENQLKMAKNIFSQLNNGGQLVCEFGGKGCAEAVHSTLEEIFANRGLIYPRVFYFPTIGEYASILENAGFRVETALLFDRPTPQSGNDGLKNWINMFVKKPFENIAAAEKENILSEAEAKLKGTLCQNGIWFIDYVRIRIKAVKPST